MKMEYSQAGHTHCGGQGGALRGIFLIRRDALSAWSWVWLELPSYGFPGAKLFVSLIFAFISMG